MYVGVCDNLLNITDGKVTFKTRFINAAAHYTCNHGYMIMGSAIRMCQENGSWSEEEPFCRSM